MINNPKLQMMRKTGAKKTIRRTAEEQYLIRMEDILTYGDQRGDRTGTGTFEWFAPDPIRAYNVEEEFPLFTTKKVRWEKVIAELVWFIHGRTDVSSLRSMNCHIWDEWADDNGQLGPVYGKQWRDWGGVDQLKRSVDRAVSHPDCRRNIVSAWNVSDLAAMRLHPCHILYHLNVSPDQSTINMLMYQRSADWFLGVPFNIASYAALLKLIAHLTGKKAGDVTYMFGSAHVYQNHVDQAMTQLDRECFKPPTLTIESVADHCGSEILSPGTYSLNGGSESLDEVCPEHFVVEGYECHPFIKADVSV